GVGLRGTAIPTRLLQAGHRVVGFDTAAARMRALQELGGETAASARAVARASEAGCTLLPSLTTVESAILGAEGIAAADTPAQTIIQMSTISPALTERLGRGGEAPRPA